MKNPNRIKAGVGTKVGVGLSIFAMLPPLAKEIVALVENVGTHWTEGEKVSLIVGAAVGVVTVAGRFAQAVAKIFKGEEA